ncbi:MAG: Cyclic pyranopterin phosphate synthase (MoaA), partial [uncultured Solirubrobacteraceae bacterium]
EGTSRRRARAGDRGRPHLGHRPLQLSLPVLHAGGGPAVAQQELAPLLRGDGATGRPAVRDGRPRRPPHRRRAARAQGALAAGGDAVADPGGPRPVADHQRLPARGPGRGAGQGRSAPRQRLPGLPGARPLLPAHATRLAGPGPRGPGGGRAPSGAAADQGQRGRAARLHRERGPRLRRVRPAQALRGPLHRIHAAGRRPRLEHRQGAAQRGGAPADPGGLPDGADGTSAVGHVEPLAVHRRPRLDRIHLAGDRALLRRLQPHPHHRRGRAADMPLLHARDRSARSDARRRRRRRARAAHPRRGVAQGAQASRQRARLRPARAHHVAHRRL